MIAQIGFGLLAACMLLSGIMAVGSGHMVRSVLWLAVTLVCTAVVYVTLQSPFMASIQIILYTGGVITLMLFGVMLTDQKHDVKRANPSGRQIVGAVTAAAVFGILASATWRTALPGGVASSPTSTHAIGASFLGQHQLAFEVLSLLLIAAMIGAIVLARRSDP